MNTPAPSSGLIPESQRSDIQGFVTSGFGHLPDVAYVFLRFSAGASARRWLRAVQPKLTTAASWRPRPDSPKQPPNQTVNVAFTASGLQALGLPESCRGSFPAEFSEGMAAPARSFLLGDTDACSPDHWQFGNDARPVHALLILAGRSSDFVETEARRWQALLEDGGHGTVVAREFGHQPDDDREPFGFRDGIAQPAILGIHRTPTGIRTGEFILGYENEYGYHPASPIVPSALDPLGLLPASPNPYQRAEHDFGRNGTFLVYRKLEQDVAGFWSFLAAESRRRQGHADPGFMVWLAAKMMGRWPGGAPLTLAPDADDPALARADHFLYAEHDGDGLRCPFGAHIRRTNPRDQLRPAGPAESLHMTARHRILRRGRPYGPRLFDPAVLECPASPAARLLAALPPDGQERGLHFLCVNASIKSQFEFIQQAWMNNPRADGIVDNPDPVSSQPRNSGPGPAGSMCVPQADLDFRTAPLPRWVTVRAGAYLFLPGLSAIRWMIENEGR